MDGMKGRRSSDEAEEEEVISTALGGGATPWTRKDKEQSGKVAAVLPNQEEKRWKDANSAYVQHLAEICRDMLDDERWRVWHGRRLFAWQDGEDLSAAVAFARLFGSGKGVGSEAVEDDEEDDLEARALLLYGRLFVRKGPWFTIDDIYARYYAPNARSKRPSTFAREGAQATDDHDDAMQDLHDEAGDIPKDTSDAKPSPSTVAASNFFLPRTRKQLDRPTADRPFEASSSGAMDTLPLQQLVEDLHRLHRMGLIRTFVSEEECGIVVGNNANHHAGVALTADQRRVVLQKLGAVASTPRAELHMRDLTPSSQRKRRRGGGPNEIWKQMSLQRSIFSKPAAPNTKGKTPEVLLPVRRHVNDVLLGKLAERVATHSASASPGAGNTNFKARPKREKLAECVATIRRLWNQAAPPTAGTGYQQAVFACFRMREAPLLTLRRMARLHLCATGGPGSMRGDGTNGWISVHEPLLCPDTDQDADPPPAFIYGMPLPPPPTACCWHLVTYPGLMHRLGLAAFYFVPNFCPQKAQGDNNSPALPHAPRPKSALATATSPSFLTRVFATVDDFRRWELAAEIRANLDYALLLHEITQIVSRRKARELEQGHKTKLQRQDSVSERSHNDAKETNVTQNMAHSAPSSCERALAVVPQPVDVLGILTKNGRKNLIRALLPTSSQDTETAVNVVSDKVECLFQKMRDGTCVGSTNKQESLTNGDDEEEKETVFANSAHEMIVGWSMLILHVLEFSFRHTPISQSSILLRPWLRHLSWESALAYALWDCVSVVEKLKQHEVALSMLCTILGVSERASDMSSARASLVPAMNASSSSSSQFILSRRVRGKAYERLVIDCTHVERRRLQGVKEEAKKSTKRARKRRHKKWKFSRSPSLPELPLPRDELSTHIESLTRAHIRDVGSNGSIPFSAIRALARRIKEPLSETLNQVWNTEMMELGLRTQCDIALPDNAGTDSAPRPKRAYSDWTPVTDFAVANAIGAGDDTASGAGKRCAYVGWEDEDDGPAKMAQPRSLTVEELAMEEYASGRLPRNNCRGLDAVSGGWVGWHDEGGHVRALFRILCCRSVLAHSTEDETALLEDSTIYLTPYQSSPLDLHVGHSICQTAGGRVAKGFYERRRRTVEAFLCRLESLDAQRVADLVFDAVLQQKSVAGKAWTKDTFLQRDLAQVRTLSMLAAGFGGTMLAAMFRCLFFDYRHYSGGLPDLLLVRALYSESGAHSKVVPLGDWIGEAFAADRLEACRVNQLLQILVDRNDEYLGCSKSADSTRSNVAMSRDHRRRQQALVWDDSPSLPRRLELTHNQRTIRVECLFVEVKSANDRLDARQEDWLNILDRVGHARVCKFGSKEKMDHGITKDPGAHVEAT